MRFFTVFGQKKGAYIESNAGIFPCQNFFNFRDLKGFWELKKYEYNGIVQYYIIKYTNEISS